MEKKRKILMIISLSLVSAVSTHFFLSVTGTYLANDKAFNVRASSIEELKTNYYYRVQYVRADYPLMKEREEITFKCHKEDLMGYLYTVDNPVGVVVAAHGVNALADGNHAQYHNFFLENNWDVFTFDMPGCGRSTGTMHTLAESRFAVQEAIKVVRNHSKTKDLNVCLMGHSWGAYGVVTASGDVDGVKAVAAFSDYDSPAEIMYSFAINNVSPLLKITKPALYTGLFTVYGTEMFYTGHEAIKNNPDINYYIYQGDQDDVVPLKAYSIYDNIKDKGYPNVTPKLLGGVGHTEPWKMKETTEYIEKVIFPELDKLKAQYGDPVPDDIFEEFMSHKNKDLASALKETMMKEINLFFLNSIK